MTTRFLTLRLLTLACAASAWGGHAWAASTTAAPAAHQHAKKPAAQGALVEVSGPWVRATVPGQSGTGGFMSLRAKSGPLQLVGFTTPVADSAELHEMAMDGAVMRMRPVDAVDLPLGQAVELKPGGHHLMLMGLKKPLKAGSSLPLVLKLKTPDGRLLEQHLSVPVRTAAPAAAPTASTAGAHDGHHDHDHAH
jgi:copper(I)-binding protein